jgi:hypothetical protein
MLAIRAIGSEIGLECDGGNTYDALTRKVLHHKIPQFVEDTQTGSSTLSARCTMGIENLDMAYNS